jgi:hypothetical protein
MDAMLEIGYYCNERESMILLQMFTYQMFPIFAFPKLFLCFIMTRLRSRWYHGLVTSMIDQQAFVRQ